MADELERRLDGLCAEYGLVAMYAFGSRALEVAGRAAGRAVPSERPTSDIDIGVLPRRDRPLSAADRVHVMQQLEVFFDAPRVDLVILPEASAFIAADVVRGELLAATDLDAEADAQLYYLRRAADLAPFLREQWRETVGSEL